MLSIGFRQLISFKYNDSYSNDFVRIMVNYVCIHRFIEDCQRAALPKSGKLHNIIVSELMFDTHLKATFDV